MPTTSNPSLSLLYVAQSNKQTKIVMRCRFPQSEYPFSGYIVTHAIDWCVSNTCFPYRTWAFVPPMKGAVARIRSIRPLDRLMLWWSYCCMVNFLRSSIFFSMFWKLWALRRFIQKSPKRCNCQKRTRVLHDFYLSAMTSIWILIKTCKPTNFLARRLKSL